MDEQADTSWRDSLMMAPGKIAGVPVRPFSAWHAMALDVIGVKTGFDAAGHGPTVADLILAIPILQSRWTLDMQGLPVASGWLRRRLSGRWVFRRWQDDATGFLRYLRAYSNAPEIEPPKREVKRQPFGCPSSFAVAIDVCERIPSLRLTEAMNMPLNRLHQIRAASLENSGAIQCAWAGHGKAETAATLAAFDEAKALVDRMNAERGK